jgi:hypothetical protein
MTLDDRFTPGLIHDVLDVLERHGYHRYDNRHTGQAVLVISDLGHVYDGTRDTSFGTCAPSAPDAGPGPSGPGQDDAVILTRAEVSTVVAALDVAADYKRDRAAGCADCADQSCGTCQFWLRDARTYDQMADQLLQTAEAARTANAGQPEPAGPPPPPRQPHPAAGKEAGQ